MGWVQQVQIPSMLREAFCTGPQCRSMTDLYKVHDLGQLAFSHNRAQAAIGLQRITDLNRLSTLLQPRVKFVGDAFVDQESRCCAADLPVRPEATKLHTA